MQLKFNLYCEWKTNYPMHVPWSRDVRWCRRSHMGALSFSENVVARVLSFNLSSYSAILTGNLDVYHIIYTQPIRASMDSPVSSHTVEPLSLSGEHTLGAP